MKLLKKVQKKFHDLIPRILFGVNPNHLQERIDRLETQFLLSDKTSVASKVGQLRLKHEWKRMLDHGERLPMLNEVEFRAFSQNGEDGILLYIFSLLGEGNSTCVEICAGDGIQCNSANLILNHRWTGLLIDGQEWHVNKGKQFYASHPDTFSFPPKFVHAWVDREGINQIIQKEGFQGSVDLLSLDLDGVDYWIWDAIEVIQPRVVVAEIQCIWGADRSVTVPYRQDFSSPLINGFGVYSGASLSAFVKLAKRKGYRLVGTQQLGFNAFFIKETESPDLFPEVTVESCLDRPFVRWATDNLLPLVKDKEWVDV
jgi:hypothetical protein